MSICIKFKICYPLNINIFIFPKLRKRLRKPSFLKLKKRSGFQVLSTVVRYYNLHDF